VFNSHSTITKTPLARIDNPLTSLTNAATNNIVDTEFYTNPIATAPRFPPLGVIEHPL